MPDLAESLRRLSTSIYPPNLRDVEGVSLQAVVKVLGEGIPLYYVPRPATARKLLAAPDTQTRRAIIGNQFDSLLNDCEEVLDLVTAPAYLYEVSAVRKAIAAIRAGHREAGHALAVTVMDTMMWRWGDRHAADRHLVTRPWQQPRDLTDLDATTYLVMRPVHVAHTRFDPIKGEIPRPFNRHAALHRVSAAQYSKRNCAIAVMLATSLLVYMDRHP